MTSADLIDELRAARPVADEALRVRVQAIASSAPAAATPRSTRRLRPRRLALVALPAAAALALASAGAVGLTRSGAPAREAVSGDTALEATKEQAQAPAESYAAPSAPSAGQADAAAPTPTPDRAQRYSATLVLEVPDTEALSRATQRALETTRTLGGYVVGVSYAASDSGVSTMTLRVPTARVSDAIVQLSGLGTITSQQVQIDDLQGAIDDLERRETALRARIAALSARLARADLTETERVTARAQRDAARRELADVRAARTQTSQEARYATIQLTVQTEQEAGVAVPPSRLDRALDEAVGVLVWEAVAVLYALVVAGPVLLALALAWAGQRHLRRRADERLLAAS